MPAYTAMYEIEIIFEPAGAYMTAEYEYEFDAEDDRDAMNIAEYYGQTGIYDDIMSNISIVPTVEYVEEQQ